MSQPLDATTPTVPTGELRAALENSLTDHFGEPRPIAELERRASAYSSSFAIEELDVLFDDGMTLRLIFKDLGRHALLEEAYRIRPDFLYDPLREIETYRSILAPGHLGSPVCYGASVDEAAGRYWLFLERVPGVKLARVGAFETWKHVSRWLARMHTRFTGRVEPLARPARLLDYDEAFYRTWPPRAAAFLSRDATSPSAGARRDMEWLAGRYERVVETLTALPVTFIHGDFYASNVLVQEDANALRVCPIDWEMAAVGPGLIDLAALTAGNWTEQERAALALAYYEALEPRDEWPPAADAFLEALDCCRLHLAVLLLGWGPDWSPPPEQAQDWLGEALRLAGRLGL